MTWNLLRFGQIWIDSCNSTVSFMNQSADPPHNELISHSEMFITKSQSSNWNIQIAYNTQTHTHTHTHTLRPTVVGAGSCVFGAGLADDVLVDLVPLVLIVAPAEQNEFTVWVPVNVWVGPNIWSGRVWYSTDRFCQIKWILRLNGLF